MIRLWLLAVLLASSVVSAQTIKLTPEQEQMLNSLPAAQRQQALIAIRDLQSRSGSDASATQSINEQEDEEAPLLTPPLSETILTEIEPRAEPGTRLVINFAPREDLDREETRLVEEDPVLQRLVGSRLFILDDAADLMVNGIGEIALMGLNEDHIKRRLEAEQTLSVFDIEVSILAQQPTGVEALEPFGYDIFELRDTSFDAPSTGPVPADYVLGPGDSIRVQLFGKVNGVYEYEVTRDGILNLPEIGPITVAGLTFSELRSDLDKRVTEMLIGTQVSVTMGPLRSVRVFVLGDVNQPGSHIVSGLATISTALYKSGGISEIGSLRDIQLKRNGRLITRLDLYDMLINGDTSSDRRLQPGDVIFVPTIGPTIAVSGAVKRPAIYETKQRTTVADAISLAGGLTADAFAEGARLERMNSRAGRTTRSLDLTSTAAESITVESGDTLLVPEILPDVGNAITLAGHLFRPGTFSWRPGMRLTDLIPSTNELKPGVDMEYVLVRREQERGQPIEILSTSLSDALDDPGSSANIGLYPRDQVFVFDLELGRMHIVQPIIDELARHATHEEPLKKVEVSGYVRAPGVYPLEPGMRVSDLVRAGGSLAAEAYALDAELTRYSVSNGEARVVELFDVDLAGALRGDPESDLVLSPYDYLSISRIPEWDSTWSVSLEGEVRFPGTYRIKRGETLASVLDRAGGLTDAAFPEGAVFLRESLREREQEQIELLARRLESDLTSLSLQLADTGGSDTLTTGRALLDQLRNTEAVGRLVINSSHLKTGKAGFRNSESIEMKDGDRLLVPTRSQVVTVIGEIQQNTSHLYRSELSRDDYINLSGGLTRRADKSRIYIVRANGAVVVGKQSRWLGRGQNVDVRPGDTIVVPLDADKMRPLTFWTNVTQILYQGAIAIAAIDTFGS